jgi:HEAT repeat protein
VAFWPDGRAVAAVVQGATISLWDVRTGVALLNLGGHGHPVSQVAFSPDGRRLASWSPDPHWLGKPDDHSSLGGAFRGGPLGKDGGVVKLWDTESGREVALLSQTHGDFPVGMMFSPDGRWFIATEEDRWHEEGKEMKQGYWVRVEAGTGQRKDEAWHVGSLRDPNLAFSPDGHFLAFVHGHCLSHQSLPGTWLGLLPSDREGPPGMSGMSREFGNDVVLLGDRGHLGSPGFSPDGKLVVCGGRIWDTTSRRQVGETDPGEGQRLLPAWLRPEFRQHIAEHFAFSPDSSRIASGNEDGSVSLCDTATGLSVFTLQGGRSPLTSVAFSPDGRWLAAGDSAGEVRVWDGGPDVCTAWLQNESKELPRFIKDEWGVVSPEAVPHLIDGLRAPERDKKVVAARALAAVHPPALGAVGALSEALRDGDSLSRIHAAWALWKITGQVDLVIPALTEEARKEGGPGDPSAALRALGRIGPPAEAAVPALLEVLLKDEPNSHQVFEALEEIGPGARDAVPALTDILRSWERYQQGFSIRGNTRAVVRTLGKIGPAAEEAVPALREVFRAENQRDPNLDEEIIVALGRIGPPARGAVPDLLGRFKSQSYRREIPLALASIEGRSQGVARLIVLVATGLLSLLGAALAARLGLGGRAPRAARELLLMAAGALFVLGLEQVVEAASRTAAAALYRSMAKEVGTTGRVEPLLGAATAPGMPVLRLAVGAVLLALAVAARLRGAALVWAGLGIGGVVGALLVWQLGAYGLGAAAGAVAGACAGAVAGWLLRSLGEMWGGRPAVGMWFGLLTGALAGCLDPPWSMVAWALLGAVLGQCLRTRGDYLGGARPGT